MTTTYTAVKVKDRGDILRFRLKEPLRVPAWRRRPVGWLLAGLRRLTGIRLELESVTR